MKKPLIRKCRHIQPVGNISYSYMKQPHSLQDTLILVNVCLKCSMCVDNYYFTVSRKFLDLHDFEVYRDAIRKNSLL